MTNPVHPLSGAEAQAYLERRLDARMDVLLDFPRYFLIETVSACNARCIMCGIDFEAKPKRIMSPSLFERIAGEIEKHARKVEKVMLYLDGEPLIDKTLPARVQRMKRAGVKIVNIASNASLLSAERGEALIRAGLDEIYITLDSLNPQTYEAIRLGLSFDAVYGNILGFIRLRDAMEAPTSIRIQMILQQANHGEEQDFLDHWRTHLGPNDQIVVQKAHNWAGAVEVMRFGDESLANAFPCIAIWGTLVVHADGTVPLCCMDSKSVHPLGSLETQSIADIWRGTVVSDYRHKHLNGERAGIPLCDGCTLWRETKHADERLGGETGGRAP